MIWSRATACFLFLCTGTSTEAQTVSPVPAPLSMAARIDAYVAPLVEKHEFSGTILIQEKGQAIAERSVVRAPYPTFIPRR